MKNFRHFNTACQRYIVLAVLIVFRPFIATAQDEEKIRELFYDAEYFLMMEEYPEALKAYLLLYKEDRQNANIAYRIGLCYLNIPGQKTRAIPYLEFAASMVSDKYSESTFQERKAPPQSLFLLGTAYQINYELEKAKKRFVDYKSYLKINDVYEIDFVDRQIEACNIAGELMKEPVLLKKVRMEDVVQQNINNYNPVMSGDGNVLIYCTEEKFYIAVWMVMNLGTRWSNPVNITSQIGSDGDTYPASISPSGDMLYLIRKCNYGSDIYVSRFENKRWSEMEKLGKPISTRNWESHACISPDGKHLYFTSNRRGGFGGLDVYRSSLDRKGRWDDPVNLGPSVNTPYNEETPFISEDGKTLFFSSQGHEGMGGFDVFKSARTGDNNWSIAVNLGYPLNSTDDDMFFYPINGGDKALYAGIMDESENQPNIKELTIEPALIPRDVKISGKILTQNNLNELDNSFMIKLVDGEAEDTLEIIRPDIIDGSYSFDLTLQPGNYQLIAGAKGFDQSVRSLNIPDDFQRSGLNIDIELIPSEIGSGEYMIIKNILFAYNSYKLDEKAKMDIERLFQIMNIYPNLYVEVTGHTDSRGSAEYNLELSRKRAGAVVGYLISKGIAEERFIARGLGESANIALNKNPDGTDNPEGRRFNRNATIKILQPENYNIVLEPVPVPDHLKPNRVHLQKINPVQITESGTYGIQIIALRNSTDINPFRRKLQDVDMFEGRDGFYRIVYGRFESKTEAEKKLPDIRSAGFEDAFIIDYAWLNKDTAKPSKSSDYFAGKYTIQIKALKTPVNRNYFSSLKEIKVIEGNDGLFRYFYNEYDDYNKAFDELQQIKEIGYQDAFIKKISMTESFSDE